MDPMSSRSARQVVRYRRLLREAVWVAGVLALGVLLGVTLLALDVRPPWREEPSVEIDKPCVQRAETFERSLNC